MPLLVTGVPCLDFVNTVDARGEPEAREWLTTPEHTIAWAEHAELLDRGLAAALRRAAAARPRWAARQHTALLRRRERLYRVLRAHVDHRQPDPADLSVISEWIGHARRHAVLHEHDGGYRFGWPAEPSFDRVGWPLAGSAARLLTGPELADVGVCANGPCGWLYLDTTKNHSRRWCTMRICGNSVKVRRFRERQRP